MHKEVIEFICDNCGEEDIAEVDVILPKQWVTVQMTMDHNLLDPIDLCGHCRAALDEALKKRRNAPSK
jgi:hypothetical protein